MIDSDFDLNFELKQIENAEHKKFRQCSAYEMHGNYIFTENGTIIYTYIIKNVVDDIIKRPSRKISNKISITKSFGSQKIKEVYRFEGAVFDSLENTASSAKNKFYILMTS